jgi:type IV secretory pathway component VirB8
MNEEFVSYYKNNMQNNQEEVNQNPLGYNMDFIRMTEDWFNNN